MCRGCAGDAGSSGRWGQGGVRPEELRIRASGRIRKSRVPQQLFAPLGPSLRPGSDPFEQDENRSALCLWRGRQAPQRDVRSLNPARRPRRNWPFLFPSERRAPSPRSEGMLAPSAGWSLAWSAAGTLRVGRVRLAESLGPCASRPRCSGGASALVRKSKMSVLHRC